MSLEQPRRARPWPKVLALIAVLAVLLAGGGYFAMREMDRRETRREARAAAAAAAAKVEAEEAEKAAVAAKYAADKKAAAAHAPLIYEQLSWVAGIKYPKAKQDSGLLYGQYLYNTARAIEVLKAHPAPFLIEGQQRRIVLALEQLNRDRATAYRADNRGDTVTEDAARRSMVFTYQGLDDEIERVESESGAKMPPALREWVDSG